MKASNVVLTGLMAGAFLFAQEVAAEPLDLAGDDRTVTALTDLDDYDGVTNSSETPAKLTFALSDTWNTVETYSGVLSGNLSVIKDNKGTLVFSAANTYTGGTIINEGKLQADNAQAFGPVNAELPIQVNADLNGEDASTSSDQSTAVLINVATFDYPINCAEWTNHGQRSKSKDGRGSGTLYNIAVITGTAATLNGKITGGDVAIHDGMLDNWAGNSSKGGALTINGEIDVGDGALSLMSRASTFYLKAKVHAGAIYHPTASDWPTATTVYSSENVIGLIDCGRRNSGGGFTTSGANVMGGAILISTSANFADGTDTGCSQNFDFGNYNQTIDRPKRHHDKALSAAFTSAAHNITMNNFSTLMMKGSASDENDWLFDGNHHLVWDPTGDYTLLNVSRKHTVSGGTIKVKRGCFAMDENCSFSNVAKIVVLENASVSNMCAFAGSFNAVADVTLGENASLWVAENPFASTVALDLAAGAKLHVPDGVRLTVTSVKYDGKYQKVGDHTTDAYMVGGGTVKVLTNPGAVEETVVWQGGTGTGFNTAANWVGKVDVPDFEDGVTTLRFAAQGTENLTATADVDAYVKGVEFGDVASFKVAGDGTHALMIGTGGVTAADRDAKLSAEIAAPVIPMTDQAWDFGSNVLFTLSGPLMTNAHGSISKVTITAEQGNPIWFVGSELDAATSDSTFAGTLSFKWKYVDGTTSVTWSPQVFATGYEPFGAATTVSIWGAPQSAQASTTQAYRQSCLWLSNTVVSANLESPYDKTQSRYGWNFCSCANSTNVVNGTVYNVRDVIVKSGSKLVFNGDVTIPAAINSSLAPEFSGASGSPLVFNGRLIYPGSADVPGSVYFQGNAVCYFNAPSNDLRKVDSKSLTHWHFGADYAFCDGKTDIGFTGDNTYADYDLHGHPQFVGSILDNSGAQTSYRTQALVMSTDAPTFIKVNQTKDAVFYGTFAAFITNLTLCGTGSLTLKTANAIRQNLVLEGATLGLDAAMDLTEKTITFASGTLSLANDLAIFKAYYVDGDGVTQPLPRGTYRKGDGSLIGESLAGTGALRVRKSDLPTGIVILVR